MGGFRLPEGRVLIPGVIDSTTNYIESSELVAQRLSASPASSVTENLIAGTDCGFSTFAGVERVAPRIAYAKLAALAEGARLASQTMYWSWRAWRVGPLLVAQLAPAAQAISASSSKYRSLGGAGAKSTSRAAASSLSLRKPCTPPSGT